GLASDAAPIVPDRGACLQQPLFVDCSRVVSTQKGAAVQRPSIATHTCFALAATLASAAPVQAQWTVTRLRPSVGQNTYAWCVGGSSQGGEAVVNNQNHAALWTGTAASWVDLHPQGATSSRVYGCTETQQVGVANFNGQVVAARWSGTAASFTVLAVPGASGNVAYAVDGTTAVGIAGIGFGHACVWNTQSGGGGFADIHPEFAIRSIASAVHGTQVGGRVDIGYPDSVAHAAVWIGGACIDLHPAHALASWCYGVHSGQQGGFIQLPFYKHAALWTGTAASFVDLHPQGQVSSVIYAVNGGHQVGYVQVQPSGDNHAAIWSSTSQSWVDLHTFLPPVPFRTSYAYGVSRSGGLIRVAGYAATNSSFGDEPILWTMPDPDAPACPADVGGTGGVASPDGVLDNNDFVVFIDFFFNLDPRADMGSTGGTPGADGQFDNNDFVVFIDRFFAGC
ncbi:MAG: GC-type dockerin domain-anchored protein, partial [Phycisphaerales bacterium]|nr:GC-type dockerin domain-anchored protein [Phycisphaerales bacterium]